MFGFKHKKLRGQLILELESSGKHQELSQELSWSRSEGATSFDIEQWWNMPDEQHREILEEDQLARVAFAKALEDDGQSMDNIVQALAYSFPRFGLAEDRDSDPANAPLPIELKHRINMFMRSLDHAELKSVQTRAIQLGSMNALIREQIYLGKL